MAERRESKTLRDAIEAEARRLGFELFGVAAPHPPAHFSVYEAWLAAGRHGEMSYLADERARQRRADPLQILPECKSILVLGARYSASNVRRKHGYGRVASYAWGDDYHDVLLERLKRLVEFIEAQVGAPVKNRYYTDTGPVLERELAQRAGLGWIGKNTCLIHPRMGSYFLLAEILLGIELQPDAPFVEDRCGSCTRCLDACPTACILPDRTLDARRCISYLTIELKGAIPVELRPQMEDWVFGCDVCQQVCPWNQRFGTSHGDPVFSSRPEVRQPHLIGELSLTPEQFNRKFKGSPIRRAKRRGYLRNVTVALGNSLDSQAVSSLAETLRQDAEPLARGHAAWALGQLGGQAALTALQDALDQETDVSVLAEICAAMERLSAEVMIRSMDGQEGGGKCA